MLLARVADFIFFFFRADSSFRLVRVPALVGFFCPDCDFQVVNVLVASLSRSFVRHFLSFELLQLHLVVVYSDVAAGAHSSNAVWYSATLQSLVRRHCGSLPQPGLLTPRKLSGMLCHRVVFDPCVSLFSVTEGRSRSLSLCSISSTASLFRGSPIPLRSTTRRFMC